MVKESTKFLSVSTLASLVPPGSWFSVLVPETVIHSSTHHPSIIHPAMHACIHHLTFYSFIYSFFQCSFHPSIHSFFFFFNVAHFESLYWICYNIASVLFLAMRHVGQAPLSVEFSRQEYWSELPPIPYSRGFSPTQGLKFESFVSCILKGGFFVTSTTWEDTIV